ncbi:spinster family MFS transporter [Duganella sp. LjRoot269]|jgi:predicted MFS family arabinose efflux permease|uniref:spinster family MFS transporter n=1 Tax=Duganella sp. LjRoot269 TaxID=3342305 RepID=UPI003ED06A17
MLVTHTRQQIRERRYVLFLLFLVSVLSYIDRTILSILQVPIKSDLGLSDAQLGALTGLSFALFYATLALPIARLADRANRSRLVAGSLAIWSGMTALTGLASSFAGLVLFRIGVAVGEAGSIPATHSIIADIYPPKTRATALAFWGLSLPAGLMLGFSCAGALEQAVGWRAAFAIIGGAGLLLAPLVLLTMREPQRGRYDPPKLADAVAPTVAQALRHLWQLRAFRYLTAAGAFHAFAWYSVNAWSAPFYVRVHGMTLSQVSFYLAVLNGVGSAVGMYLGGRLSDYFGQRDPRGRLRVVAVALLIMVPAALAQYLVESLTLSLTMAAISLTMMLVYYGPVIAVAQMLVPASMRAFTSAVLMLVLNLFGLGLGPLATGMVSDFFVAHFGMASDSLRYALSIAVLFSLVAAGLFWRAASLLPREMLPVEGNDSVRADAAELATLGKS